ncbi:preprotein translocase subunit SecG [Agaribacterium haliotis]|uniref:preprotein translocase subunit SecG n=1 Tax=Agaribacterium haliotis TaxID=2013869 RepID=UPI000BB56F1E|nr:preprotein translocase subunit SecG [Agaribacterium haliotis]
MENLILLAHLIVALIIIGLILMQQGKGAEMGASFGAGASQTLFGATGGGNFFAKLTAVFAFVFFVTSFSLAIIAKKQSTVGDDLDLPVLEEVDVPVLEVESAPVDDVPVLEIETAPVVDDTAADSDSK